MINFLTGEIFVLKENADFAGKIFLAG